MPLKDKDARRQYYKAWRVNNKELIRVYQRAWRASNRQRMRDASRRHYIKMHDRIIERQRARREQDREQVREYHRTYTQANQERLREHGRIYYLANKEKIAAYHVRTRDRIRETQRARVSKNREQIRASRRAYYPRAYELFKANLETQLAHGIRRRLRVALAQYRKKTLMIIPKNNSSIKLLGCTVAEAVQHIESQFKPGMSWANWSVRGWHIDHIRPLSKFDLTDSEHLAQACHYTNLQPLWATDNIKKGAHHAVHTH